ncbi:hypothetical protein [Bacillus sp. FSL M8-0077]|uniref:hypothetical protein n=1 Tax=Bacillus sp. FSL M8-0077 TaxID=2954556 RepID=UPI001150F8F4
MTATDDKINSQWYNALIIDLGLDPQHFQIVQGSISMERVTSQEIWRFFNTVPSVSIIVTTNQEAILHSLISIEMLLTAWNYKLIMI